MIQPIGSLGEAMDASTLEEVIMLDRCFREPRTATNPSYKSLRKADYQREHIDIFSPFYNRTFAK